MRTAWESALRVGPPPQWVPKSLVTGQSEGMRTDLGGGSNEKNKKIKNKTVSDSVLSLYVLLLLLLAENVENRLTN